jgi:hypothetical protein
MSEGLCEARSDELGGESASAPAFKLGGTHRYRNARGALTLRTLDEHHTRWTLALTR